MEVQLTDLLAADGILKRLGASGAADFPFEYSPVVAVRHSPEMLQRLIFQRNEFVRVYASFPISQTRGKHRAEIDRFREDLARSVVVYDPLTIDEGPLLEAIMEYLSLGSKREDTDRLQWLLSKTRLEGHKLAIPASKFWPIPADNTLCRETRSDAQIPADEIAEVVMHSAGKHAISRAIEHRDYRLIDQSDCIIVYRPLFGATNDRWSGGTEAERKYALYGRRIAKPVFLVHDTNDGGPYVANTFDDVCQVVQDKDLSNNETWHRVLPRLVEAIEKQKANMIGRRQEQHAQAGA